MDYTDKNIYNQLIIIVQCRKINTVGILFQINKTLYYFQ